MNALKAVFIMGPGLEVSEEIENIYDREDYLMLKADSLDVINLLEGKITFNTRIDTTFHGENSYSGERAQEVHNIKFIEDKTGLFGIQYQDEVKVETSKLFDKLATISQGKSLYIHLWGCYSQLAMKDAIYLPSGSVLLTHSRKGYQSLIGLDDKGIYESIKKYQELSYEEENIVALQDFVNNLALYSLQSVSFSYVLQGVIYEFIVETNFEEVYEDFPSFISGQQKKFIEFSKSFYSKNLIINDEALTQDKVVEYVSDIFCYDVFIGRDEFISFLQNNQNEYSYFVDKTCIDGEFFPLYLATFEKNIKVVEQLLYQANDFDMEREGYTALQMACKLKSPELVEMFLENGANRDQIPQEQLFSIMFFIVASRGDLDLITPISDSLKMLLGNNFLLLDQMKDFQNNEQKPIDLVSRIRSIKGTKFFELIYQQTSFIDATIRASSLASLKGERDILERLTAPLGMNSEGFYLYLSYDALYEMLNPENGDGETPLYVASKKGHVDIVRGFLKLGVDVNGKEFGFKKPLIAAIENEHEEVVEVLLNNGADPNIDKVFIFTPMYVAAKIGNAHIIEMLMQKGANVGDGSYSLLRMLAQNNHVKALETFVKKSTINEISKAFFDAVKKGNIEATETLLINGADVNFISVWEGLEVSSLYIASGACNIKMAELLLIYGINLNIETSLYSTPLNVAERIGCVEVVELLNIVLNNLEQDTCIAPESSFLKHQDRLLGEISVEDVVL
ncbi:MAG: ankyrin repeat domain-containing protein [Rickettsiales bacterium]|nr:ankyrin repeat domain-containing protein [Rickettsiales bacterium]